MNFAPHPRLIAWAQGVSMAAAGIVLVAMFSTLRVTIHPHYLFVHPLSATFFDLFPVLIALVPLTLVLTLARARQPHLVK